MVVLCMQTATTVSAAVPQNEASETVAVLRWSQGAQPPPPKKKNLAQVPLIFFRVI